MPRDDKGVFDRLCAASDESQEEIAFLTYAIYAREKYEWVEGRRTATGNLPAPTEIDKWIEDITDSRYSTMRERAAQLFDEAAWRYLTPQIELQKQEAIRRSILAEIRATSSWWRQLGLSLLTSILAPLIIGGIIVAALTYDKVIPTATEVAKGLQQQQENSTKQPKDAR